MERAFFIPLLLKTCSQKHIFVYSFIYYSLIVIMNISRMGFVNVFKGKYSLILIIILHLFEVELRVYNIF